VYHKYGLEILEDEFRAAQAEERKRRAEEAKERMERQHQLEEKRAKVSFNISELILEQEEERRQQKMQASAERRQKREMERGRVAEIITYPFDLSNFFSFTLQ
jgi:hypothetical protein